MKTLGRYTFALSASLLILGLATTASGQDQIQWLDDLAEAKDIAARENKLILVHFWSETCGPCKKLDTFVFPHPEVARAIHRDYVPVKINASVNRPLTTALRIERIPTDVFMTPDGSVLTKQVSPQQRGHYVSLVQEVAYSVRGPSLEDRPASRQRVAGLHRPTESVPVVQPDAVTLPPRNQNQRASQNRFNLSDQLNGGSQQQVDMAAVAQLQQQYGGQSQQGQVPQGTPAHQVSAPPQRRVVDNPHLSQQNAARYPAAHNGQGLAHGQDQRSGGEVPFPRGNGLVMPTLPPNSQGAAGATIAGQSANAPNPNAQLARQYQLNQPAPQPPRNDALSNPSGLQLSQQGNVQAPRQNPVAQVQPGYGIQPGTAPQPNPAMQPGPAMDPRQSAQMQPQQSMPPAGANPAHGNERQVVINQHVQHPSQQPTPSRSNPAPAPEPNLPPIGLDGCCSVTLFDQINVDPSSAWVPGDKKHGCIHRGKLYLFQSAEHRDRFMQFPDRFAPMLSGYDPVIYAQENRLVAGKREHGVISKSDGRIYLFASEETLNQFRNNVPWFSQAVYQAMGIEAPQTAAGQNGPINR